MTKRTLVLKKETLALLDAAELSGIAAGASSPSCGGTCLEPRCFVIQSPLVSVRQSCYQTLCICPD